MDTAVLSHNVIKDANYRETQYCINTFSPFPQEESIHTSKLACQFTADRHVWNS